jgi:serine phosphatase RsbU (regulator of sigma subunit)
VIHALTNIAGLHYRIGNFVESQNRYYKALEMAKEGGFKAEELSIYKELAVLEEAMGHFDKALEALKVYQVIKDTLQNQEARTQLNEFQAQLDLQEHKAEIVILNKENELANVMVKKQRVFTISVVLVTFLLLILIIIISYALRFSRKAKQLLEIQNHEIDKHRNEIQIKNKQFTDSIEYAGRVQKALFSPWEDLKGFFDGLFIISKPQNIVSGDFYWYKYTGSKLYFALADCTGHGVPGAFMSVLGNTFLNEVVDDNCDKPANQVLNELREKIKASLHQEGMKGNTDGMDILLCIISQNDRILSYSGANNSLYLIRKNTLIEYKADKMTISVSMKESPFNSETINLEPGDQFYLSSDGYYDQFGGNKNEKISRNRFKEWLVQNCDKAMNEQGKELEQFFETWKNNQEQTDDMMVIGFRIK